MGWKSRQEKEIRRLIELGRPVSVVHKNIEVAARPYHIAATLRKVGKLYHLLLDAYYPTGSTGETIDEKEMTFNDLNQAFLYLKKEFDISPYEMKP